MPAKPESPPESRPVQPPIPTTSSNLVFEKEESFPSLSSTTSSLASLSMSAWGRGRGQGLQEQDFPSLAQDYSNPSSLPSHTNWDQDEDIIPAKRSGKKSKKKSQVLFHFG